MNYLGKKIAITGFDGFIGSQLYEKLSELVGDDGSVYKLYGDTRKLQTFERLNHSFDYLFHFGSPSSQILFQRQRDYCVETTLTGFINAATACKENGIKLIFPSTGLLSQNKTNEYASCKLICEQMAEAMGVDYMAFRIFATYGPGEGHKRDYASVPYLFAKAMTEGEQPVIFGNGKQSRDFIYIDDVVAGILKMTEKSNNKIIELGNEVISFNVLVELINSNLGTNIEPFYIDKPDNYVEQTESLVVYDNWTPRTDIVSGIEKLLKSLR